MSSSSVNTSPWGPVRSPGCGRASGQRQAHAHPVPSRESAGGVQGPPSSPDAPAPTPVVISPAPLSLAQQWPPGCPPPATPRATGDGPRACAPSSCHAPLPSAAPPSTWVGPSRHCKAQRGTAALAQMSKTCSGTTKPVLGAPLGATAGAHGTSGSERGVGG